MERWVSGVILYSKICKIMRKVYFLLLIAGIALRITLQFFYPSFSVDEISLGNNIKYSNYIELLYPLKFGQSSPPLFLWIQKLIVLISPFSFWINIKIFSLFSSIIGLIVFYLFIRKYEFRKLFLLLFIILHFNPFIVSNSLAVKQYTIDLTGIILLIYLFKSKWFIRYNWIFFLVWSLISNIGLFACTGYLIYGFLSQKNFMEAKTIIKYIKNKSLTFLALFPYLIYFIWYMNQNGASEMKTFMVNYWSDSFIPLNGNIFNYIIYTTHGLWIYLLSSFEIWGMFLMLLMVPFFIYFIKKKVLFKQEIFLLFSILTVHLVLNIFHLYPFSDRLYLYLSPLVLLVLGSSLSLISEIKKIEKHFSTLIIITSMITLILYSFYTPYSDNDIVDLYANLDKLKVESVYVTEKSMNSIVSFEEFTDNKFKTDYTFVLIDSKLKKSKFLISRVSKKIKMNVTSPEESSIEKLIHLKKIKKIKSVNGYNIYEIIHYINN